MVYFSIENSREQEGIIKEEVAQLCRIRTEAVTIYPTSDYSVEQVRHTIYYYIVKTVRIKFYKYIYIS